MNKEIPAEFKVDSISERAAKLLLLWNKIVYFACSMLNIEESVVTGFAFDNDIQAMHSTSGEHFQGHAILICPVELKKGSKEFVWRDDLNDDNSHKKLLITVLHELAHIKINYHDSDWAELFGKYICEFLYRLDSKQLELRNAASK